MADSMHAVPAIGDLASPLVQRMRRHQGVAVLFRTSRPPAVGSGHGVLHHGRYVMAMRADDTQAVNAPTAPAPMDWTGEQPALPSAVLRPAPAVHPEPRVVTPVEAAAPAAPPPATSMSAQSGPRWQMANTMRTFVQRLLSGTAAGDNRAAPAAAQSEPTGGHLDTQAARQAVVGRQPTQPAPAGQPVQAFVVQPGHGAERVDAAPAASAASVIPAAPAPGVPSAVSPVQAAPLQREARPNAATADPRQQPPTALPPSPSLTGPSGTNSGSPPGDSLDWGRLTAILRAHEHQEQAAAQPEAPDTPVQAAKSLPPAQRAVPARARPDTQSPAVVPLAAADSATTGVQRTEQMLDASGGQTEVSRVPSDPTPDSSLGPAVEGLPAAPVPGDDAGPDVVQLLRAAPPARATESAVHVIAPRGPRPIQRPTLHMPAEPGGTEEGRHQPAGGIAHIPMVPTEIGELPVDLWSLIGETPPSSSAVRTSPGDNPAAEPYPGPKSGPIPESSVDPGAAAVSWRSNASLPAAPQSGARVVADEAAPVEQLTSAGTPDAIPPAPRGQPVERQSPAAGYSTEHSQTPIQRRAISVAEAFHFDGAASEISAALPEPAAETIEPYSLQVYTAGVPALAPVTGIEQVELQAVQATPWPVTPHVLQAAPAPSLETPGSGVDAVRPLGSVNGPRPRALSYSAFSAGVERVQRQLVEETANAAAPSEALSGGVSENLTGQIGRPESILSTPTGPAGGEPDVHQLASLVYIELRRRLAVERERLG